MKYIFAMTWSRPSATNVKVGHQMAMILEAISRLEIEMKTAKQTSQFAANHERELGSSSIMLIEIRETCQSLTANRSQKDLMPLRHQHLHCRKIKNLLLIRWLGVNPTIPSYNRHEEQHPRQIPEIAHKPADR